MPTNTKKKVEETVKEEKSTQVGTAVTKVSRKSASTKAKSEVAKEKKEEATPEIKTTMENGYLKVNGVPFARLTGICIEDGMEKIVPSKEKDTSAYMAIKAPASIVLPPGKPTLVRTGLKVLQPGVNLDLTSPANCELQYFALMISPRQDIALKYGVSILNAPILYHCYQQDEIKLVLFNHTSEEVIIREGEAVANMTMIKIPNVAPVVVDDPAKAATK